MAFPDTHQTRPEIVRDMVARRNAHTVSERWAGAGKQSEVSASCSCGWASGFASPSLGPQWEVLDEHIAGTLPDWPTGACNGCGRLIMLSPLGAWFHVHYVTHGHDAHPA